MLSSTVKSLSISYDPINEQNTFSNGDTISGRLMLELSKEAEINSLSVKVKGKADVHWREKHGDRHVSYNAKEDYFKLEHFIYRKVKSDGGQKDRLVDHMGETYGKAIPAGKHVYPFSFRIPDGKMPSSYKGIHGKVLYTVTGKLDRSMRMDQKETVVFNFLSRVDMHNPVNMLPQSGMENKKMKLFTKGSANMKVSINKKGYMPGESIMITANIENDSSRDLVPKFSLDREESFYARSHQKQFNKRILKEEGEAIPSKSHQTNNYMVKIPSDVMVSITHCRIIKVLYHLKVYLDVPYASDPEIVFPLIIFPPTKGYSPMPPPGPPSDFENTKEGGWTSYPPPSGVGGFAPPSGPGGYAPPSYPGGYAPPPGPGGYAPPPGPGGYAPPTGPGGYAPPTGPGGYAPPTGPGGYAPPTGPGGYAPPPYPGEDLPPSYPGGYPPQSGPGGYPPPNAPGGYSASNAPGGFPPQSASGSHLPQTVPGSNPPQIAPSAPPPQIAPVDFLSQSGPSAPPPMTGPVDFLSSNAPSAPPAGDTSGIYPSLSDFGGKRLDIWEMPSSIKSISFRYDAINPENTFSSEDFISGRLILEVGKRTKIDYLFIKAKGKAKALWSETHGKVVVVYYDVEKYFTLKNYIIQDQKAEGQDYQTLLSGNGETYSNVVGPGVHEYPFTFQIPEGNMPSSFKGSCGKIVYTLEAKLSRSMKLPCKTKTKFIFHSKTDPYIPQLLEPQFAMKEEKMKVFTSGNVTMNIKTERMGYLQGEGLKVTAEIENNSSRSIVPKFCLYQKQSFFVQDNRRVHTHNILKEAGEPISVSTRQKVTKVLSIPHDVSPTILNCKVVHVEYRLKLYLDIPFAKDPEIKLPVVILPADSAFAKMVQTWPPS
ncbi:uncharacterized protein LOC133139913 [Conger conger]|uniref:uncharacterized protein LOC133139913 n=1 Tax=Conger conger TaxID=82655 RepID=UPI002A5A9D33|nr:uncharacterized protein LOC133139913 [Conger conger]